MFPSPNIFTSFSTFIQSIIKGLLMSLLCSMSQSQMDKFLDSRFYLICFITLYQCLSVSRYKRGENEARSSDQPSQTSILPLAVLRGLAFILDTISASLRDSSEEGINVRKLALISISVNDAKQFAQSQYFLFISALCYSISLRFSSQTNDLKDQISLFGYERLKRGSAKFWNQKSLQEELAYQI